jgi:predicted ATP-dependent endonuclease of OLD family
MADTLQRLIFYKAAIFSNENTVLLFEEPEAHMFPPYIRKFNWDIVNDKGRGNQFFISTHSPFVLDALLEDAIDELSVYLVGLKDGETTIKRLTEEELFDVRKFGVDLFFNIESYLD